MKKRLEKEYFEFTKIMDTLGICMKKLSKCHKNPFREIEFRFLYIIEKNKEISMQDLSEEFGVTKSRVTAISSKMLENDYIYIDFDKIDKRKKILKLTQKGKETIKKFNDKHKSFFIKIFSDYTEEEITMWKNLMFKTIHVLDKQIKLLEKEGENDEII